MSIVKIRAALENALNAMVDFVPSVNITSSTIGSTATFLTSTPHLLTTGIPVSISGHTASTPDLNGTYFVVVTGANTFSLKHKVTQFPIASTVEGVGGVVRANLTAWEGVAFDPVAGVPHQQVTLLPATPDNPTFGDGHYREIGFIQVTLFYPRGFGTLGIMTRAELIKSTFPRGSSFSSNGVVVHIPRTPVILSSGVQDESLVAIVKIQYYADIFS